LQEAASIFNNQKIDGAELLVF